MQKCFSKLYLAIHLNVQVGYSCTGKYCYIVPIQIRYSCFRYFRSCFAVCLAIPPIFPFADFFFEKSIEEMVYGNTKEQIQSDDAVQLGILKMK